MLFLNGLKSYLPFKDVSAKSSNFLVSDIFSLKGEVT